MYTGHLFEEEVLGKCRWTSKDYIPFRKAMDIVKKNQAVDPTDPKSGAANDFHALVCEELGVDDYTEVSLYTSVGSPLDYYHGVDAFVEWKGAFVSIDLTLDKGKVEYKADIILHEDDVYTKEGSVNRERLHLVAHHAALLLEAGALVRSPVRRG